MSIDEFLARIAHSPQHTCFYHFTDRANLPSIKACGGLLPTKTLREKKIHIPAPGGNDLSMSLDQHYGMDEYVHLCFTVGHPMACRAQEGGRIKDIVWIRVHPGILKHPSVKITDGVSNSNTVTVWDAAAGVDILDFEVLYTRTPWKDPAINARLQLADKCEILVPGIVPLNLLQAHGL